MKKKIGSWRNLTIVQGDANLIKDDEIVFDNTEHYPVLRRKVNGKLKTFVIIPLEDMTKATNL